MYTEIKSFQHDIGNHMQTLHSMLAVEAYEDAKKYLNKICKITQDLKIRYDTGYISIDSILAVKEKEGEELGIGLNSAIHFPEELYIDENDLVTILSNSLDNAIRALSEYETEEEKEIDLDIFPNENGLTIVVANCFKDEGIYMVGNRPVTTKANKEDHGFGIKNMEKIALKYHGGLQISIEEGEFILKIDLKNVKSTVVKDVALGRCVSKVC